MASHAAPTGASAPELEKKEVAEPGPSTSSAAADYADIEDYPDPDEDDLDDLDGQYSIPYSPMTKLTFAP